MTKHCPHLLSHKILPFQKKKKKKLCATSDIISMEILVFSSGKPIPSGSILT